MIGDRNFVFRDEKSYLHARLDYLNLHFAVPFDEYLKQEMYDKDNCVMESMSQEHPYSWYVEADPLPPSEWSNTNTTAYTYNIGMGPAASPSANMGTASNMGTYADMGTSPPNTIFHMVNGAIYDYNGNMGKINGDGTKIWDSKMVGTQSEPPEKKQCKSESTKSKKEEPIDLIASRFDILDL